MTWVKNIIKAVEETLQPEKNNIVLHIDNMDTKIFKNRKYLKSLKTMYNEKYGETRFNLIFSSDNNAYDFLREYRDALFPGVPVVFCGVNDFNVSQLRGLKKFTGVTEIFSAVETLETALRLHSGTKNVYIINDYLKTGRAWAKTIRKEISKIGTNTEFFFSENLSFEELGKKVRSFKDNTIILLGAYFSDRLGNFFTYEKVGKIIAESSSVPVYCLLEMNIGSGVIGGKVISGYTQGKKMAEIGKRILRGEDPEMIEVQNEGVNRYIFDYRMLKKWNIDPANLPEGSSIVNRPPDILDFVKNYREYIFGIASVVLAVILMLLVYGYRREMRSARLIKKSEASYRGIFYNTGTAMVVYEKDTTLSLVNREFEELSGYRREELEGKMSWKDFIEKEEQEKTFSYHSMLIEREKSLPNSIEVKIVVRSGEKRDALIYATYITDTKKGIASIIDITEKKNIENERERVIKELNAALLKIKKLSGLLPICANCKKIRDDKGYWKQIEEYIKEHSDADFSHGICPDCMDKLYGSSKWYKK